MNNVTFYQKQQDLLPPSHLLWMVFAFFCLQFGQLYGQCSPDVIKPVIVCPADVTVNVAPGVCSAEVVLPPPTVSDNCPGAIEVISVAPSDNMYENGTTEVSMKAIDAAGNFAKCETNVTVAGGSSYNLVCNADVVLPADPSGFTTVEPLDILEGGPYNCVETYISIGSAGPTPTVTVPGTGNFLVVCWVALPGGGYNQCWGNLTIANTACAPDVTPPIAVCVESMTVQSNVDGPNMTELQAAVMDDGSYDECDPTLSFRATLDLGATAAPSTNSVQLVGEGDHFVALWVGDDAGNWNTCIVTVTANPPKCTPDTKPPSCIAPPDMQLTPAYYQSLNVNLDDSLQMATIFGTVTHWDNCSNGNSQVAISYAVVNYPNNTPQEISRSFWVFDEAFNASDVCTQKITISTSGASIHVPAWHYPDDPSTDQMSVISDASLFLANSWTDQIFTAACNDSLVRRLRSHRVIDWLTYDPNVNPAILPALDLNNDGITGDAYDLSFSGDSLWRVENGQLVEAIAPVSLGGYSYDQIIRYSYYDTSTLSIIGTVFLDNIDNCTFDAAEPALAGWKVKAIGQVSGEVYEAVTNSGGHYHMFICPADTALEVSLDVPFDFGQSCPSLYSVTLQEGQPGLQNIPVKLNADCPLLSVDLSTWRIRPCFTGDYAVSYCNLSNQTVTAARVEVKLDSLLNFEDATIPSTLLVGNTYNFPVGNLAPGACGSFVIHFTPDCDAPVGLTHCTEAHIFPDTFCYQSAAWSGASLEASAHCDGDSVRLELKNKGLSSMANQLDFVVVEDLIMYMSVPFQLNAGEVKTIKAPANGATWRIQSPQEVNHPWGGVVAAFVEGCGGLSQTGAALAFPINNSNPFVATDCVESVASFDPNDKQAVPRGYGVDHFIEKNTDIEYIIRFQNTGTDTAYTVVVLDTLTNLLNVASVRPGASSHHYDFDVVDGNVLRFRFDNIKLVDSTTNLIASQGFVKFRVSQKADHPDGTFILNNAAIYFDNNEPVITNFVYHTIGSNFIQVVGTDENPGQFGQIKAYPNPSAERVVLEMPDNVTNGYFTLTDAFGKTVSEANISGNQYLFERQQLPAGIYLFKIQTDGGRLFSGKIILK